MSRGAASPGRRRAACAIAGAAGLLATAPLHRVARAETAPLRIVTPFASGGLTDVMARTVAQAWTERFDEPVVVDNRSGGAGVIGVDHVVRSAADGRTLLLTPRAPITANLVLFRRLPYDPRRDLRMLSDIAVPSMLMLVHPSLPADDARQLWAAIAARPDAYAFGSYGPGTLPHQIQAHLQRQGLRTLHVPYRGEAPVVAPLLAGDIHLTVGSSLTFRPHIEQGRLRAIAVIGRRRIDAMPALRTFAEQGLADPALSLEGPVSLMVAAATPQSQVDRLSERLSAVMAEAPVRRRLVALDAAPVGNSPEAASASYAQDLPLFMDLARQTGVSLD